MGLLIATPPSSFRISSRARRQFTITTGSGSLSRLYSSFTTAASGRIVDKRVCGTGRGSVYKGHGSIFTYTSAITEVFVEVGGGGENTMAGKQFVSLTHIRRLLLCHKLSCFKVKMGFKTVGWKKTDGLFKLHYCVLCSCSLVWTQLCPVEII